MRLVDFIEMLDPSKECELIENGNIIYSGRIGNVTARIMSGKKAVAGSANISEEGILIIKIGEGIDDVEIDGEEEV